MRERVNASDDHGIRMEFNRIENALIAKELIEDMVKPQRLNTFHIPFGDNIIFFLSRWIPLSQLLLRKSVSTDETGAIRTGANRSVAVRPDLIMTEVREIKENLITLVRDQVYQKWNEVTSKLKQAVFVFSYLCSAAFAG